MTQQILLPSIRVTYNYTTNIITAHHANASRCKRCISTDIESEALVFATELAGRPVSAVVANSDNFLFR